MPKLSDVLDVAETVFSPSKGRGMKAAKAGKGAVPALKKVLDALDSVPARVVRPFIRRADAVPPPSPYPQPGLAPNLNPAKKPFPAPKPDPQPKPQAQPSRQGAGTKTATKEKNEPLQTGKGVVRMSDALRIVALYAVPAMRATAQRAMLSQQLGQSNPREKVTLAPLFPGEPTRYVQYRVPSLGIDRTDDDVAEFVTSQPPGDALT